MTIQEAFIRARNGDKVRPKSWKDFTSKLYIYFDMRDEKYKLFTLSRVKDITYKIEPELIFEDWEICDFLEIHNKMINHKLK